MAPKSKTNKLNKNKRERSLSPIEPSSSDNLEIHEKNARKKRSKITKEPDTLSIIEKQQSEHKKINKSIVPIAQLNPYQSSWIIKVRVLIKRSIYVWKNSKGEGKLFSLDLKDKSGAIKAIAFNHLVDRWYDRIEENKVYLFSNGDIKNANKQYTSLQNNFEIIFNDDTNFEEIKDDGDIPKTTCELTSLSKIPKLELNSIINVIGICIEIKNLEDIISKTSGKELKKRDITMIDPENNSNNVNQKP